MTNFPDFSSILQFAVSFKVLFYLKYGIIFAEFSLLLPDKFQQLLFSILQYIFSDFFSILGKIP